MRLLAVAALLFAAPLAQAQFDVQFDSPAQFGPTSTQGNLTWAIIVLSPADEAHLDLQAPTVEAGVNHTHLRAKTLLAGIGQSNAPEVNSRPIDWQGPMDVELAATGRWASIWIEGEGIEVTIDGSTSRVIAPEPALPLVSSTGSVPPGEYRMRERGETRLESLPDSALSFTVSGKVSAIEWHNVTTKCPVASCPDGARGTVLTTTPSFLSTSHFNEWTVQGSVTGQGTAAAITVGGDRPHLWNNGSLRMPAATCKGCQVDVDGTLLSQGASTLTDIRPVEAGRLQARMDASQAIVKVDEGAVHVAAWAVPAAGAAAAITVFFVWKAGAALLFSRLADPLGSEPRRRILEHVLANPGITFRELQRALSIGNGSATYHLAILSRAGMIAEYQDGNRRRLYENHGRYSSSWRVVALLREENTRRLVEWLSGNPGASQRSILEWGQQHGWKRTAIQERLQRLEEAGVLNVQKVGQSKSYQAKVPAGIVHAAPAFPVVTQV